MAGIPVETLLAPDDTRTVSYAPSATVLKYLREQSRPDRHGGLLALGDPVFERHDESSEPKPLPERGLLVNVVVPGSNAAAHGLKPGDVVLAYNGTALTKKDDLKVATEGDKPLSVEVWREGQVARREVAPGELGVVLDPRPAPVAIAEQRKLQQVLVAARAAARTSPRCLAHATRSKPWHGSSRMTIGPRASCSRPRRASPHLTAWPRPANWESSASSIWSLTV